MNEYMFIQFIFIFIYTYYIIFSHFVDRLSKATYKIRTLEAIKINKRVICKFY